MKNQVIKFACFLLKMEEANIAELLSAAPHTLEKMIDVEAVRQTTAEMERKLGIKRAQGMRGWYDSGIPLEDLKGKFLNHVKKALQGRSSDWIDVLNFAMMLYFRALFTEQEKDA